MCGEDRGVDEKNGKVWGFCGVRAIVGCYWLSLMVWDRVCWRLERSCYFSWGFFIGTFLLLNLGGLMAPEYYLALCPLEPQHSCPIYFLDHFYFRILSPRLLLSSCPIPPNPTSCWPALNLTLQVKQSNTFVDRVHKFHKQSRHGQLIELVIGLSRYLLVLCLIEELYFLVCLELVFIVGLGEMGRRTASPVTIFYSLCHLCLVCLS